MLPQHSPMKGNPMAQPLPPLVPNSGGMPPIVGMSVHQSPIGAKLNALLKRKKIASAIDDMLAPLTNQPQRPGQ